MLLDPNTRQQLTELGFTDVPEMMFRHYARRYERPGGWKNSAHRLMVVRPVKGTSTKFALSTTSNRVVDTITVDPAEEPQWLARAVKWKAATLAKLTAEDELRKQTEAKADARKQNYTRQAAELSALVGFDVTDHFVGEVRPEVWTDAAGNIESMTIRVKLLGGPTEIARKLALLKTLR
jgi:hypothetical protein